MIGKGTIALATELTPTAIKQHLDRCPTFGVGDYNHCQCCVCIGCYLCDKWVKEEIEKMTHTIAKYLEEL